MMIGDMSSDEYHSSEYIGSSTAKLAMKSIRLFRDAQVGVYSVPDRGYFQIGRLAHMMVLEPDRFAACVTGTGPVNPRTSQPYGRDTNAYKDWEASNPGVIVVDAYIHTMLIRMPDEVRDLFKGGQSEVSVFNELACGVKVKCRPDYLRGTSITDLKTCNDVDLAYRDIKTRSYWFSHAWYRMDMKVETKKDHDFTLVFAEKKPPYRWRIHDLLPNYIEHGDAMVEEVLTAIDVAQRTGDWSDKGLVRVATDLPANIEPSDLTETSEGISL